jgi:AcrR family transcriptional regulator
LFNQRGFARVSIDDIMRGAGLTRGGFYAHFETKGALYAEAVLHILDHPWTAQNNIEIDPSSPPDVLARQMLDAYLSREHAEDLAGQCPMIALPSDVGREGCARGVRAARSVDGGHLRVCDERTQRRLAAACTCAHRALGRRHGRCARGERSGLREPGARGRSG